MKIVSFNTNGIRARPHQLKQLTDDYGPQIIGIQESKVQDPDFPEQMITDLGYQPHYFGQKAHYGVAMLTTLTPESVERGFPGDEEDAQRRMIIGNFRLSDGSLLKVMNGYFPQGENREHPTKFPAKRKFYADLMDYLENQCSPDMHLVVMGDFNIAPEDTDIGIGEQNAKRWLRQGTTSFLPEEREWYQKLMDWGLFDSYRHLYPDSMEKFSWFNYRTRAFDREPRKGLRIDQILCSASLVDKISASDIAYDIRGMEKPSDHCPIWTDFDIE
ncbi:MAG: exodeoxyribonuclease III [Gammaproteobacteria bacterium]|nr:MAG: exodeoxyribonuclease III [Gammaproteobacteria bacterium]